MELRITDHHLSDPIQEPSLRNQLKTGLSVTHLDGVDCVFVPQITLATEMY